MSFSTTRFLALNIHYFQEFASDTETAQCREPLLTKQFVVGIFFDLLDF